MLATEYPKEVIGLPLVAGVDLGGTVVKSCL